jgi:hypothetical protein
MSLLYLRYTYKLLMRYVQSFNERLQSSHGAAVAVIEFTLALYFRLLQTVRNCNELTLDSALILCHMCYR